MTSYQNTIMDLLQGDTPKAKHDYLVALILKDVSDRDQFAIGFAEWVGNRPLPEFSESTKTWRWWNNDTLKYEFATTSELLDLYKQSLKTDNG